MKDDLMQYELSYQWVASVLRLPGQRNYEKKFLYILCTNNYTYEIKHLSHFLSLHTDMKKRIYVVYIMS